VAKNLEGEPDRWDDVGSLTTSAPKRGEWAAQNPQGTEPGSLEEPPWARVRRVQLIRREVREVLSPGAIQVLFDNADFVVEGGEELGGRRSADRRFYATVMVTIDLSRCAACFREPADEATARRVAELMEGGPLVHQRVLALATQEVAQLAKAEPETLALTIETGVRSEGTAVLLDIDVMATLAAGRG